MIDDLVLKIKEKEVLEVLKIISIIYAVFLFFLALFLKYQESIIESLFIIVFAIIVNVLNSGEMIVTEKGITTKVTKFLKYSQVQKIIFKNRILYVYTKDRNKPYRIVFSIYEDKKLINKAYYYIDSKIQIIKEEEREHQEYINNYL